MINIIVAIAEDNGIGFKNGLLCHLPGDLKRFKNLTSGHNVVMGKKTWESLPKKPLADRTNVVITDDNNDVFEGAVAAHSIEEAISLCDRSKEIFVIGGGSVYRQFMPLADRLFITHLHKNFEADTFFPEIDPEVWTMTENEDLFTDGPDSLQYSYSTYIRKI